jgi:hypothetical protein
MTNGFFFEFISSSFGWKNPSFSHHEYNEPSNRWNSKYLLLISELKSGLDDSLSVVESLFKQCDGL